MALTQSAPLPVQKSSTWVLSSDHLNGCVVCWRRYHHRGVGLGQHGLFVLLSVCHLWKDIKQVRKKGSMTGSLTELLIDMIRL